MLYDLMVPPKYKCTSDTAKRQVKKQRQEPEAVIQVSVIELFIAN